jgi:HAD superfamily hydrolase (TIGR01490 family)
VPASYFDVDGTLVKTNLIHPTLFYMVNQATPLRSLGRLARGLVNAPAMALAELKDRRTFNEMLYNLYEGTSEDRLLLLAEEAFEKVLKKALYPRAKDLVQRCRDEGHDVVLVSGALVLMEHLASYLGATHVIANRLEIHERYCTGKLLRPVIAGPEKAKVIRDHARAQGHDLDECFAYSDSYSDIPMLSVVGQPIAVNPEPSLERLAQAYHWPILRLD